MFPKTTILLMIFVLTLPLVGGCGGGHELETAIVRGRVTLDGEPVSKGSVVFSPTQGRGAMGVLQEDGSFALSTYGSEDGAIVGKHRVTIISREPLPGHDPNDLDTPIRLLVPARYSDPGTSGLEFVVEPGRTNEANFGLSSTE